jgi:hypothetical protein
LPWRRLLATGAKPRAREFHLYGLITVAVILVAATCGLWLVG